MSWLTGVLALLVLLGVPSPANAHGGLKSSRPAARSHLAVVPRELRLTFSEAPELAVTVVRLLGPDSTEVALDPLRAAPDSRTTVLAAVRGPLVAGAYTVRWQMAGADGHPTSGTFTFTIDPGAQGLATSPAGASGADSARLAETGRGGAAPPAVHHDTTSFPSTGGFDAESPAYVAVRWLQFAALLVLVGAVAFRLIVLQLFEARATVARRLVAPAAERAAAVGVWAAAGLGMVVLLRLYAQSVAVHGTRGALAVEPLRRMIGGTVWGVGWIVQALATLLALAGLVAARRRRRGGWGLAALAVLALAVTPALSGHAASAPRLTALAVLGDTAHVLGAGGWLGSLLFVIAIGVPAARCLTDTDRGQAVADLVNAFSPTALAFAAVTVVTGVFAAWLHVGSVPGLWQTHYGQLLLVKLGVLAVLAATGAYNWLRVRPSLIQGDGAARVRRSSTIELVVGVLVLVVTAVLVATPTGMDMQAMQTISQQTSGR